jgi:hypothetical protein
MKLYSFALPDEEVAAMDLAIATLQGNFPYLTADDAIKALLRMGVEEMPRRLHRIQPAPTHGHTRKDW